MVVIVGRGRLGQCPFGETGHDQGAQGTRCVATIHCDFSRPEGLKINGNNTGRNRSQEKG
jgi:hypothetical protein